jgi:RNA-binding protein
MSLTRQMRQSLIAKAHALNPIIIIGNQGISESLLLETERALYDHELIKVRIPGGLDKEERALLINEFVNKLKAECLKHIGNILILYKQSDKHNHKTK